MNKSEQNLVSEDYPWINFRFDLGAVSYRTWMELGECDSKCEHLANTPMTPTLRTNLHQVYLFKGAHATTAIEGNTLSEEQVQALSESKLKLSPSKEYLATEVRNIIDAFNQIDNRIARKTEGAITPSLLCAYNAMVLRGLKLDPDVEPGEPRQIHVGVARYRAPAPRHVPLMLKKLCGSLSLFDGASLPIRVQAILKAIYAHLYVAWIHPFGDGNGRTARLVELDILLRSGIPSPAAHLLSNHYNQTRSEYYRCLDAASRSCNPLEFVAYAITGLRDGLRDQLEHVNGFVRRSVWVNYVHERFGKEKHSDATRRKREIVLSLTNSDVPVSADRIRLLSPEINGFYLKKTGKTLTRDLNSLVKMDLIRMEASKSGFGFVANMQLMDSLFPVQRGQGTGADPAAAKDVNGRRGTIQ